MKVELASKDEKLIEVTDLLVSSMERSSKGESVALQHEESLKEKLIVIVALKGELAESSTKIEKLNFSKVADRISSFESKKLSEKMILDLQNNLCSRNSRIAELEEALSNGDTSDKQLPALLQRLADRDRELDQLRAQAEQFIESNENLVKEIEIEKSESHYQLTEINRIHSETLEEIETRRGQQYMTQNKALQFAEKKVFLLEKEKEEIIERHKFQLKFAQDDLRRQLTLVTTENVIFIEASQRAAESKEGVEIAASEESTALRSEIELLGAQLEDKIVSYKDVSSQNVDLKKEMAALIEAQEDEKRAIAEIQFSLEALLMEGDAADAPFSAIQRALALVDLNIENLSRKLSAPRENHAAQAQAQSAHSDEFNEERDKTAAAGGAVSFLAAGGVGESDHSPLSPPVREMLSRQQKMLIVISELVKHFCFVRSSPQADQKNSAANSKQGSSSSSSSNNNKIIIIKEKETNAGTGGGSRVMEHDFESLSAQLIDTKLALALAAERENEINVGYRRIEKQACALKLEVAELRAEVDDRNAEIAELKTAK